MQVSLIPEILFGHTMPKMHQEPMDFDWGLCWFWGYKESQIVDDSRHIFYVTLDDPDSKALDDQHPQRNSVNSGQCTTYPIAKDKLK